jgi:hypothetical protein
MAGRGFIVGADGKNFVCGILQAARSVFLNLNHA